MSSVSRLTARLLISVATLVAIASSVLGASIIDPKYRFRTLTTEHFVIYFHSGEERLAPKLAAIAEEIWQQIRDSLGTTPPRLTRVVLVDQTELANGAATPLPYDTVVVTAAWPSGVEFIGKSEDWLRVVFAHEFTHIAHLDRSESWARAVRAIFGRVPIAFPNLFLPQWQIEGLATYEESALTGQGRLHAGDFGAVVGEAGRTGMLQPLDRINGGLTDWPTALGSYAYGAGFHAYLANRFGGASLDRLATASAGRFPFTAAPVFRQVYGQPLGSLWADYERSIVPTSAGGEIPRRLTHHGFEVTGPRFDQPPCGTCPAPVVYSVRTPDGFPALYEVARNGSPPIELGTRFLGSTTALAPDAIYFDQQELRRNTGLYSDLYRLERRTGDVIQLTREARLLDPDLAPDGRTLVCVRGAPGRRELVLVDLGGSATKIPLSPRILVSEADTQFNNPRWSPDGRYIVVERHPAGRESEIALVERTTGAVVTVAASRRTRFVTPAWRRDGLAIVAAADLNEGPFQLYEIALEPAAYFATPERSPLTLRRLTNMPGGATWPDVSSDGKLLVFVGYALDGFDLYESPYVNRTDKDDLVRLERDDTAAALTPSSTALPSAQGTRYSPLPTIAPRSWFPIVQVDENQVRLGVATEGADVLGYHRYSMSASWVTSYPSGASIPDAASPDWHAVYQYARWRPTLWLQASNSTSFFAGPADAHGVPEAVTSRERLAEAGILLPFQHLLQSNSLLFSVARSVEDYLPGGSFDSVDRTALRSAWAFGSSRSYGYSISQEDGVDLGVSAEFVPRALGSSGQASTWTADGRVYLKGFAPRHVVALRIAGGRSTGDDALERTFHLGGAQPNALTVDFGRNAISLLRGFGSDTFAGSHVALLNLDYRFPLVRPQRGHGTFPLFLHTLHAAAFADIGDAWNQRFDAANLKTSIGGELSLDPVVGYVWRFTTTVGAAWGRDGSGTVQGGGTAYVRLGRAF